MGRVARDATRLDAAFPVPPYLPPPARTILPWARRYVATTARRSSLSLDDAWDEAITALLRAAVYFQPGAGTFHAYARTAVIRGLWRYCRRPSRLPIEGLPAHALTAPSAETVVALADLAAAYAADEVGAAMAIQSPRSTSSLSPSFLAMPCMPRVATKD